MTTASDIISIFLSIVFKTESISIVVDDKALTIVLIMVKEDEDEEDELPKPDPISGMMSLATPSISEPLSLISPFILPIVLKPYSAIEPIEEIIGTLSIIEAILFPILEPLPLTSSASSESSIIAFIFPSIDFSSSTPTAVLISCKKKVLNLISSYIPPINANFLSSTVSPEFAKETAVVSMAIIPPVGIPVIFDIVRAALS